MYEFFLLYIRLFFALIQAKNSTIAILKRIKAHFSDKVSRVMVLLGDDSSPAHQIAALLSLLPGDIILSEIPFHDAQHDDFTHFNNLEPGHTCVWVNGYDKSKSFARSHQEGYQPPGLTLTGLWAGRHAVFRYTADMLVANQFAEIIRNWASNNTQGVVASANEIIQPHPHLAAANDLFALFRNKQLATLNSEGLRRAIKFASRRGILGEPEYRKGQRCTALVAAAFQASILAEIVRHHDGSVKFNQLNTHSFAEYADIVLAENWQKMPLGQLLLQAVETSNYAPIFPDPFAVDQRYATPKMLYAKLQAALDFMLIGHYSYFNEKIIAVEKPAPKAAPTP